MLGMTLRKRVLGPAVAASLALSAAAGVASAHNYDPQMTEERAADDGQDWGWVGLLGLAGLLGLRRRDRHDEHVHRTTP